MVTTGRHLWRKHPGVRSGDQLSRGNVMRNAVDSTKLAPMTREEIAWVAGIFEGEGTILNSRNGIGNPVVRVSLHMTDKDIVDRFAAIFPFGRRCVRPGRLSMVTGVTGKESWVWQTSNAEYVQAFLAMVWPWLGERRKAKAAQVISVCGGIHRRGFNIKKLTPAQVREIKHKAAGGMLGYELADEYGVSRGNISLLLSGKIHA